MLLKLYATYDLPFITISGLLRNAQPYIAHPAFLLSHLLLRS